MYQDTPGILYLDIPDFSVALASLSVVLALVFAVLSAITSLCKRSNALPGPIGWPLFGNALQFGDHPFLTWHTWSKTYGPIFKVKGGADDWIILNDFESIKQAFETQKDVFSGRPTISLFEQFIDGKAIFYRDGEHFEAQHKFGHAALAGEGHHKRNIEEPISEEWHNHFVTELKDKTGKPISLQDIIMAGVVNSMCTCLQGKRYQYKDDEFQELKEKYNYYFPLTPLHKMILQMRFFFWLRHLPSFARLNRMMLQRVKRVTEIFGNWVEEHKSSGEYCESGDFVDEYMRNMREKTHKSFTDENLPLYLIELFVGGGGACTAAIQWALLYIQYNPMVQEKMFQEISALQTGVPCNFSESQIKLPFTRAVILESMRIRPSVPISVNHRAIQDASLMGFNVRKDTQLVSNHWAIHRDSSIWESPEEFNPERFINEQGEFVPSDCVTPFGYGLRKCIGYKMAEMIVFHSITALVYNFEIKNATALPSMDDSVFNVANHPLPFETILQNRKNS